MSEIVGCIQFHREPPNEEVLRAMCNSLRQRAPDGENIWRSGCAGLGYALLRISDAIPVEQPFTADGRIWLAADCHLYDRRRLRDSLAAVGRRPAADLSDEALILEAYDAFGDELALHLVGDFAIAIWDEPRQRLLLVRDHLGVRPLFYALVGEGLVFGSRIEALLENPGVSRELDERYIGEFLLLGSSFSPDATVYRQIRRLPAAHALTFESSGMRILRYWSPPSFHPARRASPGRLAEEFAHLLEEAVSSRLEGAAVALELSGGLDSGSIAVHAAKHCRQSGRKLLAYTNTSDALLPADREGEFAALTASRLGICTRVFRSEDYCLFERFATAALRTAEPFGNPGLAQPLDRARLMHAADCRVLLSGQVGDMLFSGSADYFWRLLGTGRWLRLIADLRAHRRHTGSFAGTRLRSDLKRLWKKVWQANPQLPALPEWIDREFAERIHLGERWQEFWELWERLSDLRGQLNRPWLSRVFEDYQVLQFPLVTRFPLADLRLVEFMLRTPGFMHLDKRILRQAMSGHLPQDVIARPKQGLAGDIRKAKISAGLVAPLPSLRSTRPYVDEQKFSESYRTFGSGPTPDTTWEGWMINFPIALAYWMQHNVDKTPSLT